MCAKKKAKKSPSKKKRRSDSPDEFMDQVNAAMEMLEMAYQVEDLERQTQFARLALEIWPDCVQALTLLADLTRSEEEARELHEQAVEAGRRLAGPEGFEQFRGHFWYNPQTRPYMYARKSQAEFIERLGEFDQAIAIYEELLELNPNDNQGCRYLLADQLLRTDRLDELKTLLGNYPDEASAWWPMSHALLEFKSGGDTPEARDWLQQGIERNPHLTNFLLSWKNVPYQPLEYTQLGEESEAIEYVLHALPAWRETPGALPWVRQTTGATPPPQETRKRFSWSNTRKTLLLLPVSDTVWELDLIQVEVDEQKNSLWMFLIADVQEELPLKMEMFEERPDDTEMLIELLNVMRNPEGIDPVRPATVRLARKTLHRKWKPKLEQLGIEIDLVDELEMIPTLTEGLLDTMESMMPSSPEEPIEIDEEELQALPMVEEATWWVVVRRLSSWIFVENEPKSMFVLLVLEAGGGYILRTNLTENPDTESILENIQLAMLQPMKTDPHKPGRIEVESEELQRELAEPLAGLGVQCETSEFGEFIDELLDSLSEDLSGYKPFAMIDCPGMTPEKLGDFYRAAAEYYDFAPWRKVPGDHIIHVHVEGLNNPDWYGIVLGQMGMELGLALYDDRETLRTILDKELPEEERRRLTSGMALLFGEKSEASPLDCEAIEEYGWPTANEQAYPTVMRVNPGLSTRMPLLWELELMQTTISAIIPFLKNKQETLEVDAHIANKETTLRLTRE